MDERDARGLSYADYVQYCKARGVEPKSYDDAKALILRYLSKIDWEQSAWLTVEQAQNRS